MNKRRLASFRSLAGILLGISAVACGGPSANSLAGPSLESNEVKIFRDEWGVPSIYAKTEEAGYFGLAYAMMEDQPERLFAGILASRGELAANVSPEDLPPPVRALFPSVDMMVESDYQAKLWRLSQLADQASQRLEPQLRDDYQQFIKGVAAYFNSHPEKLPAWAPRDITIADLIAYPHYSLWSFYQAGVGSFDCMRGGATLRTARGSQDERAQGYSNEWALMPEKTATGGAILLSDPHGGIDGRFVYEFRIHAGDLRFAGFTFGALPIVGRNEYVGWGLTTGSPDVADCYVVKTTSDTNDQYLFDDEIKSVTSETIEIKVKGAESVFAPARYTDHNGIMSVVMAERPGEVYVVSTPYVSSLEGMHNTFFSLYKASSVDAFKEAFHAGGMFPQHFLAADTHGDIMFIHAGMTPIRPDKNINWSAPVDGNTSKTAWLGIHPIDDHLIIKSPSAGFLQNNNVDPRLMDSTPPQETDGKPEYMLSEGFLPKTKSTTRALRAIEVLSAANGMTEEEALQLAFDAKTDLSSKWVSLLSAALLVTPASADAGEVFLNDLLAFNGEMKAESTGALKYVYWREALRELLTASDVEAISAAFSSGAPLPAETNAKLIAAVSSAGGRLEKMPNGLARRYGDEFRQAGEGGQSWPRSGGSLEAYPGVPSECVVEVILCDTTLFPASYTPPDENGVRYAISGSRLMRLDFYSPEGIRSYTAHNPGISDDPISPHADDQAERLLSRGEMKEVYFDWDRLSPHIVSTTSLQADIE